MHRNGLLIILVCLFVVSLAAQARPAKKNMLNSRLAEIVLTTPLDVYTIEEVGGIFDEYSGPVPHVYLLPEDFEILRAMGFDVQWLPVVREQHTPLDLYHENDDIEAEFVAWAAAYPSLFSYQSIGTTVQGRNLWMAKISDNVSQDEPEIEVKYISTMHGDELTGLENCIKFIDTLLTGYGIDPELTELVDDYEIYIMPLMNPDGRAVGTLGQRYNAHGVDLNRDFPDRVDDSTNTTAGREPETAAVMNFSATRNFVLSANFHGGTVVANYPWDNNYAHTNTFSPSPENTLFYTVSLTYSQENNTMYHSSAFPPDGTTNGADWYIAIGGMQDWNYVWMGDKEITIELSNTKSGPESALDSLWRENRVAMIRYLQFAQKGIRGIVTDAQTGDPVQADIMLSNIPYLTYSSALHGEYYRILLPGTYSLTFSAPGYVSQTVNNISVVDGTPTVLDIQLNRAPRPEISVLPSSFSEAVPLCDTYDVDLTIYNSGNAPLDWSLSEAALNLGNNGATLGGGRWIDSREVGGPAYNWVDVSTTGTQVSFTSDDQNLGPYSIGFSFPFFGNTYSQVRIAANGWVSFTSSATGATSYNNVYLPSSSAPENLLACWWDDLSPQRTGTNVRRWTNNVDSFIVSFENVQSYANSGLYDFEMILTADGSITYQYGDMGVNRLESSTIGLQNSDGTKGTTVVYNAAYIENNMAVKFCPAPAVQTIPASGSVAIGGQQTVTLRLSSCCLPDGISETTLQIASNDPDTPVLDVPVTIDAGGTLAPQPVDDLAVYADDAGLHLTWTAAQDATSYSVWRGSIWPATTENATLIGTTANTEYLTTADGDGPEYFFVVSE